MFKQVREMYANFVKDNIKVSICKQLDVESIFSLWIFASCFEMKYYSCGVLNKYFEFKCGLINERSLNIQGFGG